MTARRPPKYIEDPEAALANSIEIHGFFEELFDRMLVDDSHYLEGGGPSPDASLIPINSSESVSYTFATFVADCLAFEHASPFQAIPHRRSFSSRQVPWTVKPPHRKDLGEIYFGYLTESYERAHRIAEGLWFHPRFRFNTPDAQTVSHKGFDVVKLDFSQQYGQASQALHLYNAALRQTDPLSQFLNYYRIIENLTNGSNGKQWVEENVGELGDCEIQIMASHGVAGRRVGLLQCVGPNVREHVRKNRLNMRGGLYNFTELLRARALARLSELKRTLTAQQVAARFWTTNRCGIAHGARIRRHDLDIDFKDILADLAVIRFLARLIIEQKLGLQAPLA